MIKKITTEKDINVHDFRVKVGTMDKKNPEVIYVECGTYITPKEHKKTYIDDIHDIKRKIKEIIRKMVISNELFYSDYICTIDIPCERITPNKKTFITFDYTLKQKNTIQFHDLTHEHKIFIDKVLTDIAEVITEYGFIMSKGKK